MATEFLISDMPPLLANELGKAIPWTDRFTHVHLLSGLKGREVSRSDSEVVIQCELGWARPYDEDLLHLIWAPLNNEQQGEQS